MRPSNDVPDRKIFQHQLLNKIELESYYTDTARVYITPEGNHYPSVTSVIGQSSDKAWYDEWVARVGQEKADAVSNQASHRGSAIHEMAERYVLNEDAPMRGHGSINKADFLKIARVLNSHVDNIRGIELPLYSDYLKTAGRTDLVADFDGVPSLIDFKTSKRIKDIKDIKGYYIQTSCYAYMCRETYQLDLPQLVIIMMIDHETEAKVMIQKTSDYTEAMKSIFVR